MYLAAVMMDERNEPWHRITRVEEVPDAPKGRKLVRFESGEVRMLFSFEFDRLHETEQEARAWCRCYFEKIQRAIERKLRDLGTVTQEEVSV